MAACAWNLRKMAGNSHYFFVLAKTGFIFCKIPKVFLRYWIKSSFVDLYQIQKTTIL
ncbi:hypothetical protein BSPWISOXPB_3194 [uncultured Gammaproteobacteria bacterium]|nr:hypothetical protein BSPWISOXPB_3194 [uncultured Gammaproteobacteria bacterium]